MSTAHRCTQQQASGGTLLAQLQEAEAALRGGRETSAKLLDEGKALGRQVRGVDGGAGGVCEGWR